MSRCWSVQPRLTCRQGPSTASETDITPRQNDEPQSQPRADYPPYCEPLACYHFAGPRIARPERFENPRATRVVRINYGFKERTSTCLAGPYRTAVPFRDDQADTLR